MQNTLQPYSSIIFLAATIVIIFLLIRRYLVQRLPQILMWIAISVFGAILSLSGLFSVHGSPFNVFIQSYLSLCVGMLGVYVIFTITVDEIKTRDIFAATFMQLFAMTWSFIAAFYVKGYYWQLLPSMLILAMCEVLSGAVLKVYFNPANKTDRMRVGVNIASIALVADAFLNLASLYMASVGDWQSLLYMAAYIIIKLGIIAGFLLLLF